MRTIPVGHSARSWRASVHGIEQIHGHVVARRGGRSSGDINALSMWRGLEAAEEADVLDLLVKRGRSILTLYVVRTQDGAFYSSTSANTCATDLPMLDSSAHAGRSSAGDTIEWANHRIPGQFCRGRIVAPVPIGRQPASVIRGLGLDLSGVKAVETIMGRQPREEASYLVMAEARKYEHRLAWIRERDICRRRGNTAELGLEKGRQRLLSAAAG